MPIIKEESKYTLGKTIQPFFWYTILILGCLLNIIIILNCNFFFSFFFSLLTNYISTLYPATANVILFISSFNEIYDLEFIIIFICLITKYFFIFIYIFFFFFKNILYFYEFLIFFQYIIKYIITLYFFSYIFFNFFPYFIFNQISNIFQLMMNDHLLLNFNINIITEINNISIYLTLYLVFCIILKNYIIFISYLYPCFIYIILFTYFYKQIKKILKTKRKSGI